MDISDPRDFCFELSSYQTEDNQVLYATRGRRINCDPKSIPFSDLPEGALILQIQEGDKAVCVKKEGNQISPTEITVRIKRGRRVKWNEVDGKLCLIDGRNVYFYVGHGSCPKKINKEDFLWGNCPSGYVKLMFSGDEIFNAIDQENINWGTSIKEFCSWVKSRKGRVWIPAEYVIDF